MFPITDFSYVLAVEELQRQCSSLQNYFLDIYYIPCSCTEFLVVNQMDIQYLK